jgi:hypothetical protein
LVFQKWTKINVQKPFIKNNLGKHQNMHYIINGSKYLKKTKKQNKNKNKNETSLNNYIQV